MLTRPLLAFLTTVSALAPGLVGAAPPSPSEVEITRAVYPKIDLKTHETGDKGAVCNSSIVGNRTAHLLSLKPWRGPGGDQWIAAFGIWVREVPEQEGQVPNEDDGWAQSCGPRPAQVALLERGRAGLRVVARSNADLRVDALDLAPYRLRPGETLIGVRGTWMNHGFGDTLLTLLRVEGERLVPVTSISVEVTAENLGCKGTVTMIPHGADPADLRVTWQATQLDDDANEKKLGTETLLWRWTGQTYSPVPEEAARVKWCVAR